MHDYDTIVVGGGHNGLVCAAYLAKGGQRVLVLEASDSMGGLASTREFHPGFSASVAHTLNQFSPRVAEQLQLSRHGFKGVGEALPTVGLNADGEHMTLQQGQLGGVSQEDAAAYLRYNAQLKRFALALKPAWLKTMPRVGSNSIGEIMTFAGIALKLRMLGKDDMREFLRVAALPARDLMDENFSNDLLKAVLAWDGLVGSSQAPRSPNNTVLTMLYRMTGEHEGAHSVPPGGMASLIDALAAAASGAGAELRCGSPVKKILVSGDENGQRAVGVQLADGDRITAQRVVSATDPRRTFVELVGVENLEIEFSNRIRRLRCDGFVAKLHLALSGLPEFTNLDRPDGRLIIAPDMDAIEFAYDDAKYGGCPQQPVMEVLVPSIAEPSLAPEGQHVLSANVMYVPYGLKGGWDDAVRSALLERVLDTLVQYAPGLRQQILHAQLLTPADLERDWNVTGGHWHHTELAMDQLLMMRPTYEAGQYATPIPGLHLCSAGSHPGGGVMGGAGYNAAREILK